MKLAYVAYSPLDSQSANSIQTYNTCAALAARLGDDLEVIVPRFGKGEDAPPFPAKRLARIPVNKLSRIYRTVGWSYAERSIYALRARRHLETRRADLVYCRDVICAYWLVRSGQPVIYEVHDLESLHPSGSKGPRLAQWMKQVDERTLRGARGVVSLTQTFKDQMVQWGWQQAPRIFVIPDAFDDAVWYPRPAEEARSRLGLPADAVVVGYAGMTFAYRQLALMLQALKEWNEPRARALIIGGRPAERRELQEQAREIGVEARVSWHERQPAAGTAADLSACDILVIPGTVTDATASPLKMFEYMALARPIVTVDRPALREILGSDAAYFRPGDGKDLARVLCELAASPERRQALAAGARARAGEYTYGRRADKIIAACGELYGRP